MTWQEESPHRKTLLAHEEVSSAGPVVPSAPPLNAVNTTATPAQEKFDGNLNVVVDSGEQLPSAPPANNDTYQSAHGGYGNGACAHCCC